MTRLKVAHNLRRGLRLAQKHLFARAIERFRRAISMDERCASAHLHLARALAAMGDPDAAPAARRAVELQPRSPAFLILAGEALLDACLPRDAEELFAEAHRMSPGNDLAVAYGTLARWRNTGDIACAESLRISGLPDSTAFLCRLLMTVEGQLRAPNAVDSPPVTGAADCRLPFARGGINPIMRQ